MPFDGSPGRFVVLEGNRRLAALKVLENPELLSGAVAPKVLTQFRRLSKDYALNPVETIQYLVVNNRDEARPWIDLSYRAAPGTAARHPSRWLGAHHRGARPSSGSVAPRRYRGEDRRGHLADNT